MKKQLQLRIIGRVQGVYYRASTQRKARELGLSGWVRNEADGSVSLVAEGTEEALRALVRWCGEGPPLARVQEVQVRAGEVAHWTDFLIRRD